MISVIIPVHNEHERIGPALEQLNALKEQQLLHEVLVVRHPGESYHIPTLLSPKQSRAAQMNHGAMQAGGEILLFLHADTILPEDALPLIAKARTGAFSLRFASSRLVFKIIGKLTSLRSKILRLPYGDQAIFMPKDDFFKAGGYADVPMLEDVLLAKKIRPRVLPQHVLTSPRRYESHGIIRTILRHRAIMLGHFIGLCPQSLHSLVKR